MTVLLWCLMVVKTESRQMDEAPEQQESERSALAVDGDMASILFLLLVIGGILATWEIMKWMGYELYVTCAPGAKERKLKRLRKLRDSTAVAIQEEIQARRDRGSKEHREAKELSSLLDLPMPPPPQVREGRQEDSHPPTPPALPPQPPTSRASSSNEGIPAPPPPPVVLTRAQRRNYTLYVPVPSACIYIVEDSDKYHAYSNCTGLRRLTKPLVYRQLCTFCKDRAQAEMALPISADLT